jgi:hypothetical protein
MRTPSSLHLMRKAMLANKWKTPLAAATAKSPLTERT